MNWYLEALKKYAVFSGRARRKEYWYFALFHTLIIIVLIIIDIVTGSSSNGIGLLSGLYILATLIPYLAVGVRRLHDTNRSGWWILIGLVPIIGIVFLVFMVQDSQPSENQYGPNPKVVADSSGVAAAEYHSTIQQQTTRPTPAVALEGRVSINSPAGQQQTAFDEERIYAIIAKELETGVTDKGLWTRLFAECGGDEKQTKVLYIKQRAERLMKQSARERADEAARLEQIRLIKEQPDKIQALSATHAALMMLNNVARSNLQEVSSLLSEEPLLIAAKNRDGDTPLHIAVREKNHAMARFLLEKGAMTDVKNCYGVTPLEYAENSRQSEMVKLLTAQPR